MLAIIVLGPELLEVIGSQTVLLRPSANALLCTAVLLEFVVGQFTSLLLSQGTRHIAGINALAAVIAVVAAAFLLHYDFSVEAIIGVRIFLLLALVVIPTLSRGLRLLDRPTA
jgi:hypothetical protein